VTETEKPPIFLIPDYGPERAPCRGLGQLFYGTPISPGKRAVLMHQHFPGQRELKNVCTELCPRTLARHCLTLALENLEQDGMWGGTTGNQRSLLITNEADARGLPDPKHIKGDIDRKRTLYRELAAGIVDAVLPLPPESPPQAPESIASIPPAEINQPKNPKQPLAQTEVML